MKKIVIMTFCLMAMSVQGIAQMQTPQPRNPNYSYSWWYEDWWNSGRNFIVSCPIFNPWLHGSVIAGKDVDEIARVFYLDTPIYAIGIAFLSRDYLDFVGARSQLGCDVDTVRMYEVNDREITCVGANTYIHQGYIYIYIWDQPHRTVSISSIIQFPWILGNLAWYGMGWIHCWNIEPMKPISLHPF